MSEKGLLFVESMVLEGLSNRHGILEWNCLSGTWKGAAMLEE